MVMFKIYLFILCAIIIEYVYKRILLKRKKT